MNQRLSTILLVCIALILAFLLFFGKNQQPLRSIDAVWDSGHILAFWLWSYILLTRWPGLAARSFWLQAMICMAVGVTAGFAVEFTQDTMGREFSYIDMRKNVVGCAMAIFFSMPARKQLAGALRIGLQMVMVMVVIFEMTSLGRATIDDIFAYRQYPVLCDFETPFEKGRWIGNTSFQIDRNIKKHGQASLKVIPNEKRQTRATLLYLAGDWTGYQYLELDVYNPLAKVIQFKVGVHDDIYYNNGWQENDRFIRYYKLSQGWNHIRIAIDDIRNAPDGHQMHMTDIQEITFWAWRKDNASVIYIDTLKLSLT